MNMLQGIKVLDMSRFLPGPYCTLILGDLGAEVIKIEHPTGGDPTRHMMPEMYYTVNRNRKSVCVDLKDDAGKAVIYDLAQICDVAVEGFRPGVMDRLNVGYDDLKKVNPEIIYASISGFGQTGPYTLRPGHDINYLALAGALSIPAKLDQEPERSGLPVADLASAMYAVIAILTAVIDRSRTGKGRYLDVSMTDVVLSLAATRFGDYMTTGKEPDALNWEHVLACNDIFDASDGKIAFGALEQHFWEGLCKALNREDLLEDDRLKTLEKRRIPEHGRIIKKAIAEELIKKTRNEWMPIFDEYGVPASPVNSGSEALTDENFIQRDMVKDLFVPDLNKIIKQVGFPVKISETSDADMTPPPALGEHTDELMKRLGYDEKKITRLKENNVIA